MAYELNRVESGRDGGSATHGGIRLKYIATEEPVNAVRDTTFYEYLEPGIPVYCSRMASEEIYYSGFKDEVEYTRAMDDGSAFLKSGNNGIYYPAVKEILPGRGSRVYRYHIPRRHSNLTGTNEDTFFPFHLYGLPVSVEEYDALGELQEVTQYLYYTDSTLPYNTWHFHENGGHFYQGLDAWNYAGDLPQVQANRFYMNEELIERDYRSQGNVELYDSDRYGREVLDVYDDIYVPNLQPRLDVLSHVEHCSSLRYGGATVPKQILTFRVTDDAGALQDAMVGNHAGQKGILISRTTYYYDNPDSAHPTRVETTDAQGNATVTTTERVAETACSASAAIQTMQEQNVLQPVVRKTVSVNGKLEGESVTEYELLACGGKPKAVPARTYSYFPDADTSYAFSYPSAAVFRPGLSYFPETLSSYDTLHGMVLPAFVQRRDGSKEGIVYDRKSCSPIVWLDGRMPGEVAVASPHRYTDFRLENGISREEAELVENIRRWVLLSRDVLPKVESASIQNYLQSEGYALVRSYIDLIAAGDTLRRSEIEALESQLKADGAALLNQFSNMADQAARFCTGEEHTAILNSAYAVYDCATEGLLGQPGVRKAMQDFEWTQYSLKLFLLTDGNGGGATVRIRESGGDIYKSFTATRRGHGNVQVFEIPLYEYSRPEIAFQVANSDANVLMAVLAPEYAVFNALCLNRDGTVHASFDQGGYAEFYEYEEGGSKVTVRDGNGNMLSESRTHSCSAN